MSNKNIKERWGMDISWSIIKSAFIISFFGSFSILAFFIYHIPSIKRFFDHWGEE